MTRHLIAFRSQSDREREMKLQQHYKQIAIGSIAAAASAIRRQQPVVPRLATRAPLQAAE